MSKLIFKVTAHSFSKVHKFIEIGCRPYESRVEIL